MMAEGLRSKARSDPLKDDEKLESFKLVVAIMLATAMKEQQTFIEKQFINLKSSWTT